MKAWQTGGVHVRAGYLTKLAVQINADVDALQSPFPPVPPRLGKCHRPRPRPSRLAPTTGRARSGPGLKEIVFQRSSRLICKRAGRKARQVWLGALEAKLKRHLRTPSRSRTLHSRLIQVIPPPPSPLHTQLCVRPFTCFCAAARCRTRAGRRLRRSLGRGRRRRAPVRGGVAGGAERRASRYARRAGAQPRRHRR